MATGKFTHIAKVHLGALKLNVLPQTLHTIKNRKITRNKTENF